MKIKKENIEEFDGEKFSIPYAQMIKFMDAKFSHTECPQCGKDEGWTADTGNEEDNSDVLESMTLYKHAYVKSNVFRISVVMTCRNCGSMRFIAAQNVLDWIRETQEQQNG